MSAQIAEFAECTPRALTQAGFLRMAQFITVELGIKMPESKASMIESRLMRRVRELGMTSVDEYGDYLFAKEHTDELEYFINAITTNKTDFYRESDHFRLLTERVVPDLLKRSRYASQTLKIWSAACSSGEEPYTIAMALDEYGRRTGGLNYAILATDISTKVLSMARQAIYSSDQAEAVPVAIRRRCFMQSRDAGKSRLRIVPELRARVSFFRLNLMDEDYCVKDRFDVIFLRNVLIYFSREVQERVVCRLCEYLNPGGYFFVGHAETLTELQVPLRRIHNSVYQSLG